jgi:hypothetical protein
MWRTTLRKTSPLTAEMQARLTGAPSQGDFMRACYCVRDHGDGTATVVLDWYEMSVGRDYSASDVFMRTDLSVAKRIVKLLNDQIPFRAQGPTLINWPDELGD